MSLFGEADAPSPRPKSSLFDDDAAQASKTGSSMFDDSSANAGDYGASPWEFTPKKKTGGRSSLVKSLLADVDVPELYVDTYDRLQNGSGVPSEEARKFLRGSSAAQDDQSKIWDIVTGNGATTMLGRGEINVLLALIGLAQEGEELSLDAVDERRRRLPTPRIPERHQASELPKTPQEPTQSGAQMSPEGARRKPSFGLHDDPWGSPAMHKGHGHTNGLGAGRTTSSFTTTAQDPVDNNAAGTYNGQVGGSADGASWGGAPAFGNNANDAFGGTGAGGFGDEGNEPPAPRRTAPVRHASSKGVEETVTVNMLEEKEGMFMFQHRNYEVASARRNSKVIRRYSDFVWLLDCLHKRYPFRQLPLLPPKRVAINGNHIAADALFVEKRRRGLARFANALVRHPVLREEQLVVMFLTVPTVDACVTC